MSAGQSLYVQIIRLFSERRDPGLMVTFTSGPGGGQESLSLQPSYQSATLSSKLW